MKKLLLIPLLLSLGFVLEACTPFQLLATKQINKQYPTPLRFTLVAPLTQNPYWDMIRSGMEEANKKLGVDTKYVAPAQTNPDEQINYLEAAIASKVDGIITVAYNTKQFTPIINKAVEAGIPVVLIDNDAPQSKRAVYIGTSNTKFGIEAGKLMVEATKGNAVIGIITAASDQTNLRDRIDGFTKVIKRQPKMKIVSLENGNSDLLQITEKTQKMLKEHPDITAIFCSGGYGAIGAAKILSRQEYRGKITLIGFDDVADTINNIKNGIVYGSIVQNTFEVGYLGVKLLKDLKEGKNMTAATINPGITIVTKKNVNTYKNSK